jgi:ATP-dependent Clp protease ATP-binding subunit ClpC
VFERFTERARQVVIYAQDEARSRGHAEIGTEHLLLGLIREGNGIAARALQSAGVHLDRAGEAVEARWGRREAPQTGQMPFTTRAHDTLKQSAGEASALGHGFVGTEHVALALTRPGASGGAIDVLADLGIDPQSLRVGVLRTMSGD